MTDSQVMDPIRGTAGFHDHQIDFVPLEDGGEVFSISDGGEELVFTSINVKKGALGVEHAKIESENLPGLCPSALGRNECDSVCCDPQGLERSKIMGLSARFFSNDSRPKLRTYMDSFCLQHMRNRIMNRIVAAACAVFCIGFLTVALAQDGDYSKKQGELMSCSPPKFMLVSEVDMNGKTITGMLTQERQDAERAVIAYHMQFKLSEIQVSDARRTSVKDADIPKLKGKLVVLYDGKEPLSAAYMGLFQNDTTIVSFVPSGK